MSPRCCRWYTRLRRPAQILALCAVCALPWLNAHGWNAVSGDFFALNLAGAPFADPLSALQLLAAGMLPGARLWTGALLALLLALLLGRVFCSWVCPYGLLSELAYCLGKRLRGSGGASRSPAGGRRPSPFLFRLSVTAAGLLGAALSGFPLLNRVSLPGELSLLPLALRDAADAWASGGLWWIPALVAGLLSAELLVGRRLWCRYVCPQSVCLGLASRCFPNGLRVRWTPGRCTCRGTAPCHAACSLALHPRRPGGPPPLECTNCGDCVAACARHGGALRLSIGSQNAHSDRTAAASTRPSESNAR